MKSKDGKRGDADGAYRKRTEKQRRELIENFARVLLAENAVESETAANAVDSAEPSSPRADVFAVKPDFGDGGVEERGRADHGGHRKRLRDMLAAAEDLQSFDGELLLEALFAYLIPRKDTAPLADEVLEAYDRSLWKAISAPPDELAAFPHMTERAARAVSDVARLVREQQTRVISLRNREQSLAFFASLNAGDCEAKTHIAYLDADFRVIAIETFRGDVPTAPATIVASAFSHAAKSVIIGRRDSAILPQWQNGAQYARTLAELLDAIEVTLLDIIVFTGLGYYSLGKPLPVIDGVTVFTFTPLTTVREVGTLLHSATVEDEDADER